MAGQRFKYGLGPSGWEIDADGPARALLRNLFESEAKLSNFPEGIPIVGHLLIAGYWCVLAKHGDRKEISGALLRGDEYRRFSFDPFHFAATELNLTFVLESIDAGVNANRCHLQRLINARQLPCYLKYAAALFRWLPDEQRQRPYWSALPLGSSAAIYPATCFSLEQGEPFAASEVEAMLREPAARNEDVVEVCQSPSANDRHQDSRPDLSLAEDLARLREKHDALSAKLASTESTVDGLLAELREFVDVQVARNEADVRRRSQQQKVQAVSWLILALCVGVSALGAYNARSVAVVAAANAESAVEQAQQSATRAMAADRSAKAAHSSAEKSQKNANDASAAAQALVAAEAAANKHAQHAAASETASNNSAAAARIQAETASVSMDAAALSEKKAALAATAAAQQSKDAAAKTALALTAFKEAKAQADAATLSRDAAATSAKGAASSSILATQQADKATESAALAGNAATTAKAQADAASKSKDVAMKSAEAATSSADTAGQQAKNAATSASSAAVEASSAKGFAGQARSDATAAKAIVDEAKKLLPKPAKPLSGAPM